MKLKNALYKLKNIINCLICYKDINLKITFYNFFTNPLICEQCFKSVFKINHHFYYRNCKIKILFHYKGVIKELILRWKFFQDKKAKKAILFLIKNKIPYFKKIIFPPSLLRPNNFYPFCDLFSNYRKYEILFYKKKSYQQSQKNFKSRKSFIAIKNKKINNFVLVDDIYTSGSTIKKCIDLILEKNNRYFEVIIFATTQKFNKIC